MTQEQSQNVLIREVHWVVLNHLAVMACSGKDSMLMDAGFNRQLISKLKTQSLLDIKDLSMVLGKNNVLDVEALRNAMERANIPQDVQLLLKYGASNKVLEDFCYFKGVVDPYWRKVIKAEKGFKQRCVPTDQYNVLWETLEALKLKDVKRISKEQLIDVAIKLQLSVGAIWAEICDE